MIYCAHLMDTMHMYDQMMLLGQRFLLHLAGLCMLSTSQIIPRQVIEQEMDLKLSEQVHALQKGALVTAQVVQLC